MPIYPFIPKTKPAETDYTLQRTTITSADTIINDAKGVISGIGGIDSYTKLMLHCDGENTNTFIDSEITPKSVSTNGTVKISKQYKFGTASGLFDGNGDYISTPDHADFQFGTNDFTIDLWFKLNSTTQDQQCLFSKADGSGYSPVLILYRSADQKLDIYATSESYSWNIFSAGDINQVLVANQWYHFALVRNGSNFYAFIDGVQKWTGTSSASLYASVGNPFYISRAQASQVHNGYIDEFRVSNIARWTTGFTAPTVAYTSDANTKLLLHFDGENSSTFTDETGKSISVFGNATLSTKYKFGTASGYFDGTSGGYLSVANNGDFDFGSGDFTIDWWEYRTASGNYLPAISSAQGGSFGFVVGYLSGSTSSQIYMSSNGSNWDIASGRSLGSISLNTWIHYAVVRSGNTFYAFQNGVQTDIWTNSYSIYGPITSLTIGGWLLQGTYYVGNMDEIRISKGIARWTSNFTPPVSEYTVANIRSRIHNKNSGTTACDLYQDGDIYAGSGNSKVQLTPSIVDGATAVAHTLDTENALTTAGSLLMRWLNNGVEKAKILYNGSFSTVNQFISTLATGTKPLDVTSTTVCTNLNADMVDGSHTGTSGATIPLLNGSNTHSGSNLFTGTYNRFGGATHYSEFEADGTYKMNGDATVFDDINISANSLGTGASAPVKIALDTTNIRTYAFNGTAITDELHGSFEIPHGYKEGTNLSFHVHWMPTTTGAGNVKWQLEYFWINGGGTVSGSTTIAVTTAAGGTAWVEKISIFADISGSGKTIQGRCGFRIFRDPTDAADTYGDDAALLDIGVHYEMDTIGSRAISTK